MQKDYGNRKLIQEDEKTKDVLYLLFYSHLLFWFIGSFSYTPPPFNPL